MSEAVNLDDPSTWPESLDQIEAVANTALAPDVRKGYVESEAPAGDAAAKSAQAEAGNAPAKAGDAEAAAPDGAAANAESEPEWVLMADGKHAARYEVLKEARAREAAARADLERTREELEALRQQAGAPGNARSDAAQDSADGSLAADIAEAEAWYAEVKDDDPDLARAAKATLAALRAQERMAQQFAGFFEQQQAAQQQRASVEQAEIAAAVERNPVLAQWVDDPVWMQRAQAVEQSMLADPQSAYGRASDWDGRFAAVVQATEAMYGPSPASQRLTKVPTKTSAAAKANEPAEAPAPASISSLMGGETGSLAGDALANLERMSPTEMMAHLGALAEKGALADLIYRVS